MQGLHVSDEEARALLRRDYGIEAGALERFGSEWSTLFRVGTDEATYALKAQRCTSVAEREVIAWKSVVMTQLSEQGLPIPPLVPNVRGDHYTIAHVGSEEVSLQLMHWAEGRPYAEVTVPERFGEALGELAARMVTALESATAPQSLTGHDWDARRSGAVLEALLERDLPEEGRIAVETGLKLWRTRIEPRIDELPKALVHQDLHDSNVIADAQGNITAVVDFDDIVAGWRVAELAVAGGYYARTQADPLSALDAVRKGWERVIALTDAEQAVYEPLALVRLTVNTAVWSLRYSGPRGEYARMRSSGALATVQRVLRERGRHE